MENYFDNIEDFIKGKLSLSEKAQFEKQMLLDTNLANELAIKRLELESYELLVENSLRRNMSDWNKERQKKPVLLRIVRSGAFQWAAAASVLLIAGIFYWNNTKPNPSINDIVEKDSVIVQPKPLVIDTSNSSKIANQEPSLQKTEQIVKKKTPQVPINIPIEKPKPLDTQTNNEEIVAMIEEFASPPDFKASVRGASRGPAQDSIFNSASTLLQSEQYKKAEPLLLSIEKDNEVKLYLAYAYLKTQDYDKALPLLEELSKIRSFNLVERAEWYLVLAYISKGKRALALPLLNKIVEDTEHPFNKSGIELLLKLK